MMRIHQTFGDMEPGAIIEKDRNVRLTDDVHFEAVSDALIVLNKGVVLRSGCVIYSGCIFGERVAIGHNAIIRENTEIGRHSYIGSNAVVEGNTTIGEHTGIFSQCHITAHAEIGDYVFFGPSVVTMNEKKIAFRRKDHHARLIGPRVRDYARIGSGSCLLPEVEVGEHAVVGVGAIVTKNVEPYTVVVGNPARKVADVEDDEIIPCQLCSEDE